MKTSPGVPAELRTWFTRPPRAHGEIDDERTVSFLELFYDLVFVVLIAQMSHTLAGNVSWVGVRDFALVFVLIWLAWANGTFYHELHGREDGRSRSFIFNQMIVLVVLAVYTAHAADDAGDGRGFAITYTVLLAIIAWQWFVLRRYDDPAMVPAVNRYVAGMVIMMAMMTVSALVDDQDVRLILWAITIAVALIGALITIFRPDDALDDTLRVTESVAERFGLLTIIVLGEVVVGVADGLSEAERDFTTIATGVVALIVGFGLWWNYFDLVGRRQPRSGGSARTIWNLAHLPMWLGIAASGAGMVSLIEHAGDSRAPAATAWLVSAAAATALTSLALIASTMPPDAARDRAPLALLVAAVTFLGIGALRPAPLLLVGVMVVVLMAIWIDLFANHVRSGTPFASNAE